MLIPSTERNTKAAKVDGSIERKSKNTRQYREYCKASEDIRKLYRNGVSDSAMKKYEQYLK
jgi:hypothetical protein